MRPQQDSQLLTAKQVAELCQVAGGTVHNWVARGCLACFRTPGRHLRFQANDVVNFLRVWGYPVPRKLASLVAPCVIVVGDRQVEALIRRLFSKAVTVYSVHDFFDAAMRLGTQPTRALVVQAQRIVENALMFQSMAAAIARTNSTSIVVLGELPSDMMSPFATCVPMSDTKGLRLLLSTGQPTVTAGHTATTRKT